MRHVAGWRSSAGTRRVLPRTAERLTILLAIASLAAGLLTSLDPAVLTGSSVMNGSARGTGIVVAFVAVPTLLIGLAGSRRGSVRAAAICLGSAAYLTYNAVMFCFATPLNQLFLVYVSMLSTGIFVLANVVPVLARSTAVGAQRHVRWVGWWMLLVVGLNGALWLKQAVSAVLSARPIDSIAGTGLTTNPVWVQDLAVWLPVMAWLGLGAVGSLRRRPTLMVAGLFFWVVEAIGVAVDQWWGHHADPTSPWASSGAVWLFLATAVVGLLPLAVMMREVSSGRPFSRSQARVTGDATPRGATPRPRMQAD